MRRKGREDLAVGLAHGNERDGWTAIAAHRRAVLDVPNDRIEPVLIGSSKAERDDAGFVDRQRHLLNRHKTNSRFRLGLIDFYMGCEGI